MEKYIIKNANSFDIGQIFECGQAFRWFKEEDGSYSNIAYGKVINLKREGKDIIIKNTNEEEFNNIWEEYFDLKRDYEDLKLKLSKDEVLKKCIEYGNGIRILNQEPFEMIITFIISANNQIPRIKKSVNKIAEIYGEKIEYDGKIYYSFPDAKTLSKAEAKDLKEYARVGFRDERIVKSAKMIADGDIDFEVLYNAPIEEARIELMKLPGVGPKVADCVLLFAFQRSESFPVDVWIKRVMEELYLKEDTNKNKIAGEGRRLFGDLAGFAQQYLFFYGRENNLGK